MFSCTKCLKTKPTSDFSKNKTRRGHRPDCKDCQKVYRESNKERRRELWSSWYHSNRVRHLTNGKAWRSNNRERSREYYQENSTKILERRRSYQQEYYQSNKHVFTARNNRRRASELSATPPWISLEQLKDMKNLYRVCRNISESTGKQHHVDHIVPLKGENVCGLHVPWNLRIIPAKMNLSKGNRLDV